MLTLCMLQKTKMGLPKAMSQQIESVMRPHGFSGRNLTRDLPECATLLEEGVAQGYGNDVKDIHDKTLRLLAKLRKSLADAQGGLCNI